jgi:hypothetical protein
MRDATACGSRPRMMGFLDRASGMVWPIPDADYTLEIWYVAPFTRWTAGETPSPNQFNLPDEQLRIICRFGAPGYLQLGEKDNTSMAQANLAEMRSQAKVFAMRNVGGRGGQVSERRLGR